MRLSVRINDQNGAHVRFTVFVNGANAGDLCLRTDEAQILRKIILNGCAPWKDSFEFVDSVLEVT